MDEGLAQALAIELEQACGQRPLLCSGASGIGVEATLDVIVRGLFEAPEETPDEERQWSPL